MIRLAGLLLLLSAGAAHASSPPPVRLTSGSDSISLAGHVAVLRDDAGTWTLAEVQSPDLAARFELDPRWRLNFGFTTTPYWYRVTLSATGSESSEWVFAVEYPVLDHVDIHVVRATGAVTSVVTGDLRQPSPLQLRVRPFAVRVPLAPREAVTVYVRAQTAGQHLVPLVLWNNAEFAEQAGRIGARDGAYLGIFLVMALYNFVIFAWLRDRAYLWYSLYLASGVCFGLIFSGLARQYGNGLFADAPYWIGSAYPFFQALNLLLLLLFAREFLQLARHAPRLDSLARGLIAVSAVTVLLWPHLPYSLANQANTYFGTLVNACLFGFSAYLAARGVRPARFFLAAWCLLIAVFIWATLAALGIVASSFWTTQGFPIGLVVVVVLLSAALADRVLQERKDRFAAAERARRLKDFLPQRVADLVAAGDHALLEPKRRDVTVCMIDLRGFTPFSERAAPDDVMTALREFYDAMGRVVERHGGTVEHFAGDSMLIFFNAPLEIPQPERRAVECALAMRAAFQELYAAWHGRGHELGLGIGIAGGEATIGAIGFAGRSQYAAIGAVTNLASRLCGCAQHGDILATSRVVAAVEGIVDAASAGEQAIRGFSKPVRVFRVLRARPADDAALAPALAAP